MMLICDRTQPRHYSDETGRYWSVSQVCEIVAGKCDFYAPGSAERGEDLHIIFALAIGYHIGKCDAPDVPIEYAGYYRAMQTWIAQVNPVPTGIEETLKHATLPYAGTADFIGRIGEDFGVLDLKTGKKARWHHVQICAYKKMVDRAAKQWILYIDADGGFKQVLVKPSPKDWAAFQNGLSILQWREQ